MQDGSPGSESSLGSGSDTVSDDSEHEAIMNSERLLPLSSGLEIRDNGLQPRMRVISCFKES